MTAPRFRQGGGLLLGFVIGLLVGLAIATAVAVYISNAPLPFVTKVRPPPAATVPADGKLPDPNRVFNSGSPPPPAANAPPAATAPAPPPSAPAPAEPVAAAPSRVETPARDEPMPESSRFLLQVGAFKSPQDADGMRAQLALMGLEARIFPIEQGGQTLYRVRLGPYGQLDDVNRVRRLLADNQIEAQIVRLR
jgi:cell division protein FtsN